MRSRGAQARHSLDIRRVAEAIKGQGIDPRLWASYGTVAVVSEDGEVDYEDPNAVYVGPEGVEVDVILEPLDIPAVCKYAGMEGGCSVTVVAPIRAGDRVLVICPDGDLTSPTIVAVLHSAACPMPVDPDDPRGRSLFKNDRTLIYAREAAGPIDIRTEGGARLEMTQGGEVVANQGDRGVARIQDTTKLTMSPADIQALAANLLLTGAFTPSGSGPNPPPAGQEFADGEITSSSDTVKAGD